MRFVFRRSGSLIGLYVGLVLGYGSLALLKEVEIDTVKRVLTGLVAASGLLHFYYDGFIWKVRERSTREHLGLAGGSAAAARTSLLPSWALHGLKWVAVFVLPLGAMWIGQIQTKTPETERESWIVADLPQSDRAHYKYAVKLQDSNRLPEAEDHFRTALRLNSHVENVDYELANNLSNQGKFDEAASYMQVAMKKDPRNAEVRADYGYVLQELGQTTRAEEAFSKALQMNPKSGRVHYRYAMSLLRANKLEQAAEEFQKSLACNAKSSETHYHYGRVLYLKGDLVGAKDRYLEAARLDPKAPVHNSLGVIYMRLGQTSEAIRQFEEALRRNPDDRTASENLAFARRNAQAAEMARP